MPTEQELRSTAWMPHTTEREYSSPRLDAVERRPVQPPTARRARPQDPAPASVNGGAIGAGGGRCGRGDADRDVDERAVGRLGTRSAHAAATAGTAAGGGARTGARSGVGVHAALRVNAVGNDMRLEPDHEDDPPGDSANGAHRGRRSRTRRGLGLTIIGGCAGLAIVGFLVFCGGTPSVGGNGAPSGSVAAISTPVPTSPAAGSISAAPTPTITGSDAISAVSLSSPAISALPSSSKEPSGSATSAQALPPITPSAVPTSASSSPTSTQPAAPAPSPTPSASHTHVTCFLFCW